jgi:hypothetical protein
MRRLEGQHLALFGQHRFEFRQPRAGARRHHQLGRIKGDDAGMPGRAEQFALRRVAVEILAAAAANAQRRLVHRRGKHALAEFFSPVTHLWLPIEA